MTIPDAPVFVGDALVVVLGALVWVVGALPVLVLPVVDPGAVALVMGLPGIPTQM